MALKKRVLMKDVAAKAGVHQTTVSLALRNHPGLPEKTKARIRKIADEMGYRPDPSLRALNSYRKNSRQGDITQEIAYIVNIPSKTELHKSHVYSQYLKSAQERAKELGYNLEVFFYGSKTNNSRTLNRILRARGIQGVIIGAFDTKDSEIELEWDNFSVVKIELPPIDLELDAVLGNQMFAVRLAMRKLLQRGYKRVGLAVTDHDEKNNRNLFTGGYAVGQRNYAPEDRVPPLIFPKGNIEDTLKQVKDWALKYELEAIISNWNNFDSVAWEITDETGKPCRFVPLDANERTSAYGGVDQNHREVARHAVDLLDGKIMSFKKGQPTHHSMTLIDPLWIELCDWTLDMRPTVDIC
jgi:LacI family transcriptional regulator